MEESYNVSSIRSRHRYGGTLLEVLLVTFLLSTVALAALSVSDRVDLQMRFEDTRSNLERIRGAVTVETGVTVNGQPVTSGSLLAPGPRAPPRGNRGQNTPLSEMCPTSTGR